jgi:integrase/recombinase XerD
MTPLRRRMIEDMSLRGLSSSTQVSYVEAVKALAKYYRRPPDQLTEEHIRHYFTQLIRSGLLSANTIRLRLFGIKFLYQRTLKRNWPVLDLIRIRRSKTFPVVLSREEVRRLLARIQCPEARMSAMMMYCCGLRVSEAVTLRAEHIDSQRMVVHVRNSKGNKDRYVPLPKRALELLRVYWRKYRPPTWLFPSAGVRGYISPDSVRQCIKAACGEARITKNVSCHTLRHSYATHLVEDGVELRAIQGFLGHQSIRTTAMYTHLTTRAIRAVKGAIDELMRDL